MGYFRNSPALSSTAKINPNLAVLDNKEFSASALLALAMVAANLIAKGSAKVTSMVPVRSCHTSATVNKKGKSTRHWYTRTAWDCPR